MHKVFEAFALSDAFENEWRYLQALHFGMQYREKINFHKDYDSLANARIAFTFCNRNPDFDGKLEF